MAKLYCYEEFVFHLDVNDENFVYLTHPMIPSFYAYIFPRADEFTLSIQRGEEPPINCATFENALEAASVRAIAVIEEALKEQADKEAEAIGWSVINNFLDELPDAPK